jgi:hypothetical protein
VIDGSAPAIEPSANGGEVIADRVARDERAQVRQRRA